MKTVTTIDDYLIPVNSGLIASAPYIQVSSIVEMYLALFASAPLFDIELLLLRASSQFTVVFIARAVLNAPTMAQDTGRPGAT